MVKLKCRIQFVPLDAAYRFLYVRDVVSYCANEYGVLFHVLDVRESEIYRERFHHVCGYESPLLARVNANDHVHTHGHGCVHDRAYDCERHFHDCGYAHAGVCARTRAHVYADVSLPW